jgi:hypothetical protein
MIPATPRAAPCRGPDLEALGGGGLIGRGAHQAVQRLQVGQVLVPLLATPTPSDTPRSFRLGGPHSFPQVLGSRSPAILIFLLLLLIIKSNNNNKLEEEEQEQH